MKADVRCQNESVHRGTKVELMENCTQEELTTLAVNQSCGYADDQAMENISAAKFEEWDIGLLIFQVTCFLRNFEQTK